MTARLLNPRQQAILEFLATWEASPAAYHPPTVREVMHGAGLQSTSHVAYHLTKLVAAGYITMEQTLTRTVRLTRWGKEYGDASHHPTD